MGINMRKIRNLGKGIFLIILFIGVFFIPQRYTVINSQSSPIMLRAANYETQDLTTHVPIIIFGDEDFESYGFTGNGSSSNPYLIKHLL